MEFKINIEPNDYKQPLEVRPEVVQGICDAFLTHCCDSTFHPHNDGGCYRQASLYITKYKTQDKYTGFECEREVNDSYSRKRQDAIRIHGSEMKAAFEVLMNAGYHIYRVYDYGTWLGYEVHKKPYYQNGTEVFSFDDFID